MAFTSLLKAAAQRTQEPNDPWTAALERLSGIPSGDGLERISTQTLFDALELPKSARTPGAARRVAKIMRDLGWVTYKGIGLSPHGSRTQIRGYARACPIASPPYKARPAAH